MKRLLYAVAIAALGIPGSVNAQGAGLALHAGSLGLGGDFAVAAGPRVNLRGGANFFPFDINFEASDIDFDLDLPTPQFTALLDLFVAGGLRLSGGVVISTTDVEALGDLTQPVEIGSDVYTPAEVGTLSGAIINRDVSPYLGIGFGNVARSGVGFFLDLGIAFQGDPSVTLAADGPVSSDPLFQTNLELERQLIEDDVDIFQFYPVLSIGVSFSLYRGDR